MGIAALWILGFCLLAALILEIIVPTGSIPGPVEIFRHSREATARSIRYLRILDAFVHSGFGRVARSGPAVPTFGPALVRASSAAGVTFVKLGQILGTRSDLLPDVTVRTRSFASDSDRRWIRGVSTDALSAFLGIAAFIAAVVLIVVTGGPMLTDKLSLHALMGFAIGLGGTILGLRTIIKLFTRSR